MTFYNMTLRDMTFQNLRFHDSTLMNLGDVPYKSKFSQFHAIFWKSWQNCILAPPGGLAPPPTGNFASTPSKNFTEPKTENNSSFANFFDNL